jgi:hypothetical protein
LAQEDQECTSVGSVSSGADGQRCSSFNETLFLELNGSDCRVTTQLFSATEAYSHDPSLPGCARALAAFRAATQPPFTCDCRGDYAKLGGTLRSGTVFNLANAVAICLTAFVAPAVGTYIDLHKGKGLWWGLVLGAGSGMIGQAVVGKRFLWLVGLSFMILTVVFSENVQIPRQAYLDDVKPRDGSGETHVQATLRVAGRRLILSYVTLARSPISSHLIPSHAVASHASSSHRYPSQPI